MLVRCLVCEKMEDRDLCVKLPLPITDYSTKKFRRYICTKHTTEVVVDGKKLWTSIPGHGISLPGMELIRNG